MVEEIEETLQEKFENLKIKVEYVKIKMYKLVKKCTIAKI